MSHWSLLPNPLRPLGQTSWLGTHAGASFALPTQDPKKFNVYISGRDSKNRSVIGLATLNLESDTPEWDLTDTPIFQHGSLGAFDENGVSYPWLVQEGEDLRMYYNGWMPSVLTPFHNHLGLAVSRGNDDFSRYSKAPILERTDDDYLSIGSCCVLKDKDHWKMWYTCFLGWKTNPTGDLQHEYSIKFATSKDGLTWVRNNQLCFELQTGECAIARPSVIQTQQGYHMWFCYRGEDYKIGYAFSKDGISWARDDQYGLDSGLSDWCDKGITYPHVFQCEQDFYMLACGNRYGQGGLGVAKLSSLPEAIHL